MKKKCESLNLLNFHQLKNRLISRTTPFTNEQCPFQQTLNILLCFSSHFINHEESQGREKSANKCTQTTLIFKKSSPLALVKAGN